MPFDAEPLILTEEERQEAPADDAVADASGGRRDKVADDSAARGWSFLLEDSGFVGHERSDDCALEKSFVAASHRRFNGGTASRPAALREDAETAGQGAGRH